MPNEMSESLEVFEKKTYNLLFEYKNLVAAKTYVIYKESIPSEKYKEKIYVSTQNSSTTLDVVSFNVNEGKSIENKEDIIKLLQKNGFNETHRDLLLKVAESISDDKQPETINTKKLKEHIGELGEKLITLYVLEDASDEKEAIMDKITKLIDMVGTKSELSINVNSLAVDYYLNGKTKEAITLLKKLSEREDETARNNYAYILRREEAPKNKFALHDVLNLLRRGVVDKDAFSIVNMALALALIGNNQKAWKLADRLMEQLPIDKIGSIVSWWTKLANDKDGEGYLVLLWLLKHEKISNMTSEEINDLKINIDLSGTTYPKDFFKHILDNI